MTTLYYSPRKINLVDYTKAKMEICQYIIDCLDPFDKSIPEIEALEDGSFLIDGLCLMEDVNDALGLDLRNPAYDTIAGYTLGKIGRIPKVKEKVECERITIQVEAMDGMRIDRLKMIPTREDKPGQ